MANSFNWTPETLYTAYLNYLDDLGNHKFIKLEPIKTGGKAGELIKIPIDKPRSVLGFCEYSGMDSATYYEYLNAVSVNIDKELVSVITRINDNIKDFQITGALANVYNPIVAMRINGISDKTESTIIAEPTTVINIQGVELSTKE
jgi:hypothetical protein